MSHDEVALLEAAPASEVYTLAEELRMTLGSAGEVQSVDSAAFTGTGLAELILVLGSSGAIAAAARVLTIWLEGKKSRVIKINKTELKGYSVEDAIKLLAAAPAEAKPRREIKEKHEPLP